MYLYMHAVLGKEICMVPIEKYCMYLPLNMNTYMYILIANHSESNKDHQR